MTRASAQAQGNDIIYGERPDGGSDFPLRFPAVDESCAPEDSEGELRCRPFQRSNPCSTL